MVAFGRENKMGSTREAQLDFSDAVVVWHSRRVCVTYVSCRHQKVRLEARRKKERI